MLRCPYVFGDYIGGWHRKFCLLPRKTYDGRIVWLRWVWRRRVLLKEHIQLDHPLARAQWWMYTIDR